MGNLGNVYNLDTLGTMASVENIVGIACNVDDMCDVGNLIKTMDVYICSAMCNAA